MNISYSTVNQTRVQRFGKGASILRSNSPIADDQIRAVAPSIFATDKHASRSERYQYIPTSEVLTGLRREGYQPFAVYQGGSGDDVKRNFTKHMLRLRHESVAAPGVGQTFQEIVLINAHDGTSSYQLMAGIFRLVCSNGMVVGNGTIEQVRIKHTGDVIPSVIEGCNHILHRLPEASESVAEMNSLQLSAPEQAAFASAALQLRYDSPAETPITSDKLLTLKRRDDAQPTLWNTLNTVQENIIRGGISYIQRNERGHRVARRQTREVRGIDQNTAINRALWTLAEEMKRIKAA
jgi:hypothetical protein